MESLKKKLLASGNSITASQLIELLDLHPLREEGGYFRQTYKSTKVIPKSLLPAHPSDRAHLTAIYYMITPDSFSALHRVPQVEIFHFYFGDPVEMIQIDAQGELRNVVIGNDLLSGHRPQVVVNEGIWQGTRLLGEGKLALLGCTVSPGFEFEDFEMGTREQMSALFPQHKSDIIRFTR